METQPSYRLVPLAWCLAALACVAQEPASSQPAAAESAQSRPSVGTKTLPSVAELPGIAFAQDGETLPGWTFEALGYKPGVGNGRVVTIGPEGHARSAAPEKGEGVLLSGTALTARGDLLSEPFQLAPYRWLEVEVSYKVESGEPMVFLGLRPGDDRRKVDIAFLRARKGSATVRLHSSDDPGPYRLSLSVGGEGQVRFTSVQGAEVGEYQRPQQPLVVVDIRSADPDLVASPNFERVRALFGFPAIHYLHYSDFDAARLEELDPAVILLPGLWASKGLDHGAMDRAVLAAAKTNRPMVGMCLGHQVLARAHGAEIVKGTKEWGATQVRVRARDPLFRDLPRGRAFVNSESHRYEVRRPVGRMQVIGSSEGCTNQVFRYRGRPWYSFQGHIERCWDVCSPEALILWKNMFRIWQVLPEV